MSQTSPIRHLLPSVWTDFGFRSFRAMARVCLVFAVGGLIAASAQAASINWGGLQAIGTDADATLTQAGTYVEAADWGTGDLTVDYSGGSIDFTNGTINAGGGFVADANPENGATNQGAFTATGNANFNNIMSGFAYDGVNPVVTINNLNPGQRYSVQLFGIDDRSCCGGRHRSLFRRHESDRHLQPQQQHLCDRQLHRRRRHPIDRRDRRRSTAVEYHGAGDSSDRSIECRLDQSRLGKLGQRRQLGSEHPADSGGRHGHFRSDRPNRRGGGHARWRSGPGRAHLQQRQWGDDQPGDWRHTDARQFGQPRHDHGVGRQPCNQRAGRAQQRHDDQRQPGHVADDVRLDQRRHIVQRPESHGGRHVGSFRREWL